MAPAGLEARYRRLLRWFPVEHRARHGEEMVGVLLAAAPPDRQRPGLAEAANLLSSAVRIRLRPGRALSDRDGWRDALAVFSIAAPALTVLVTGFEFLSTYLWNIVARDTNTSFGFGISLFGPGHSLVSAAVTMLFYGQAVVLVLAWLGLRRSAAIAAGVPVLYVGFRTVLPFTPMSVLILVLLPIVAFGSALEVFALLASPGPRHGRALMRGRHWAAVGVGALAMGALRSAYDGLDIGHPAAVRAANLMLAIAAVILMLTVLTLWLAGPAGKRVAVLFALLSYPDIEQLISWYARRRVTTAAGSIAATAVVALAIVLLVRRTLRASRMASRGDGTGIA